MAFIEQAPALPLAPGQDEIAVIRVSGGAEYADWETVWVQLRWNERYDYCRFTAAERREDVVPFWRDWKLGPCDTVEILLAGQLAMTGTITERQVAYDVANHGVQLVGKGKTVWGYKSSVNTETGSFDGLTFEQIMRKCVAEYGPIQIIGKLNSRPFVRVQCNPGEPIWNFLENLARPRGIVMGSDKTGAFVFVGDHVTPPGTTQKLLKEGVNIKSMNFTVNIDDQYVVYKTISQTGASDGNAGTAASEQESAPIGGSGCSRSILITPAEQPVATIDELNDRNKNEAKWREGAQINATVVVQGWTYDGKNLWDVGGDVWVDSPMCPLNQRLKISRVTFTQDRNSGSQTTLDLVLPWLLNDTSLPGFERNVAPPPGNPPTPQQLQDNAPTP